MWHRKIPAHADLSSTSIAMFGSRLSRPELQEQVTGFIAERPSPESAAKNKGPIPFGVEPLASGIETV